MVKYKASNKDKIKVFLNFVYLCWMLLQYLLDSLSSYKENTFLDFLGLIFFWVISN